MWSAITRSEALSGRDAGFAGSGLDQRLEQVDLVVAVHVLQHAARRSRPMPVSTQGGSGHASPAVVAVELHEHVVPDLDEAVAVFFGRARGPPQMSGPWS
jgi:hypothetical protein